MKRSKLTILLVDIDTTRTQQLTDQLGRRGHDVIVARSKDEAHAAFAEHEVHAALVSLDSSRLDGLALCERIVNEEPAVPVLLLSSASTVDVAVKALRAHAWDLFFGPMDIEAINASLTRAAHNKALREEVKRLREDTNARHGSPLAGHSATLLEAVATARRAAESDASMLLTGERGTGKKALARFIHDSSRRKNGPFVSLHCGALPPASLELELFGAPRKPGVLARAEGGTVVFEELGALPAELQVRLARALAEITGVRVISTSSANLGTETSAGRFREELYNRVAVVTVELPPLRQRGDDVMVLAQHFVRQFAQKYKKSVTGLAAACAEKLATHRWPGNVLELQNVIDRAVALAQHDQLTAADLPTALFETSAPAAIGGPESLPSMETIERRHILAVLTATGGHRTRAAQILGLDRKTLYRKLESYDPVEVQQALTARPQR